MKKFLQGLLVGLFISILVVRAYQLHMIKTIEENDYTLEVSHKLHGFYPSDYETIDDGKTTVIFFEYPWQ